MLSSASQMDINNIPTPDNINPEGLNGVGDASYVIAGALPG